MIEQNTSRPIGWIGKARKGQGSVKYEGQGLNNLQNKTVTQALLVKIRHLKARVKLEKWRKAQRAGTCNHERDRIKVGPDIDEPKWLKGSKIPALHEKVGEKTYPDKWELRGRFFPPITLDRHDDERQLGPEHGLEASLSRGLSQGHYLRPTLKLPEQGSVF